MGKNVQAFLVVPISSFDDQRLPIHTIQTAGHRLLFFKLIFVIHLCLNFYYLHNMYLLDSIK